MGLVVSWCLRNKSVVILAALLLVGSGAYATTRLNQELLPDISFPLIIVSTPLPGASPDVVDEQVTQPIESAVGGVGQIESVQSTSSQGFSVVAVEFDLDRDTDEAETEIQDALEGLALPEGAEEPDVQSQSASEFPILNLSLSAKDGDLAALTDYAEDEVVPEIEDIQGVGAVDLVGGAENRIEVDLKPEELKERGLTADAVAAAVGGAEVDAPVGSVEVDGLSTPVRATSGFDGPQDLEDLPVGSSAAAAPTTAAPTGVPTGAPTEASSGAPPSAAVPAGAAPTGVVPGTVPPAETPEPVLLGDVAEVRSVSSDLAGISRTNGEPSLGINVVKEQDANTVEVAREVEGALEGVREDLGGEQVTVVANSATDVEESVSGLVEEGLIGAALAIAVIFVFLRSARATLVTAVSLPTSVLAALLFSWADNLTLNVLTLAGLTIAVGRVVDDAIVVLENSYRYVQRGYDPERAALVGTTEVASAITSSTLSTAAVFVPLALVGGIISKFFVPLSLTVALALLASLIVSITIIPVLVSVFIKRQASRQAARESVPEGPGYRDETPPEDEGRAAGRAPDGERQGFLARLYAPALRWSFRRAGVQEEGPEATRAEGPSRAEDRRRDRAARGPLSHEGDGLLVRLYAPMLRWALRHRLVVLLLALVLFAGGLSAIPFLPTSFFPPSQERLLIADVELDSGVGLSRTSDRLRPFEDFLLDDSAVDNYQLFVGGEDTFTPDSPVRPENQAQAFINVNEDADVQRALDRIGKEGQDLYGEGFQVQIISNGPPQGGLDAVVTGGSEDQLQRAADEISDEFSKLDDVNNVRSDVSGGAPEVAVTVNPEEAAQAGLSPAGVSASLGTLLGEQELTSIGETPVVVGVPEDAADSTSEVRGLPVGPGSTVGDVADVEEVASPTAISRADGERAVTVTANITSPDTQAISAEAKEAVADLDLPGNVTAAVGGETEDIDEGFRNLFLSIIVALALVYLILVVFFGSLTVPLVILLSVPLTTVGAFGALLLTNTALSLPSLLGLLLLIGIVVSNSILLVDFAIKARQGDEDADEAIVEAGRARLRPILMTALATIFALLPLGLGLSGSSGGLISSSLAITVIGGLATSTFLTLLVVPVGYSLLEGSRRKKKGRVG